MTRQKKITTQIPLKVSQDLKDQFNEIAARTGHTPGSLARQIICEWVIEQISQEAKNAPRP